jgi:hypothetical protein
MSIPSFVMLAGLLSTPLLPAQVKSPPSAVSGETKYNGEVRKYTPGSVIELDIGDKRSKTYDLTDRDTTYQLDPELGVGRNVSIVEAKDAQGRKLVTITLTGKP